MAPGVAPPGRGERLGPASAFDMTARLLRACPQGVLRSAAPNFAFTFQVKGEGKPNNFEFKLVDPSGKNVWWRNQRDYAFPADWQRMVIRKSRLEFAWGPGRGDPKQVGSIEIAISAGEGGAGSVWMRRLAHRAEVASHERRLADARARTSLPVSEARGRSTGRRDRRHSEALTPSSGYSSTSSEQRVGGLATTGPDDYAPPTCRADVERRAEWTTAFETTPRGAGATTSTCPTTTRYVRFGIAGASRGRVRHPRAAVKAGRLSASPNAYSRAIARDRNGGIYPKYSTPADYWTVAPSTRTARSAAQREACSRSTRRLLDRALIYADGGSSRGRT